MNPGWSFGAEVVALSSPELWVNPMLALLDGKSIVATSVLLTSTRSLGSQPVTGLCSARRPKWTPCCGLQGVLPVQTVKQRWSAVERWKRNGVKPCTLRVRHEMCLCLSHTRKSVCVCDTCEVHIFITSWSLSLANITHRLSVCPSLKLHKIRASFVSKYLCLRSSLTSSESQSGSKHPFSEISFYVVPLKHLIFKFFESLYTWPNMGQHEHVWGATLWVRKDLAFFWWITKNSENTLTMTTVVNVLGNMIISYRSDEMWWIFRWEREFEISSLLFHERSFVLCANTETQHHATPHTQTHHRQH